LSLSQWTKALQKPPSGHHRHRVLCAYIIARDMLVATLITSSFLVHTVSLGHTPTMVILIFNNQLVNVCITGLPISDSLEMQWLQGPHTAHQMQLGSHEGAPCLQQKFEAAQTNQDTVDTSGIPPYLKRKQTRHDGTACSPLTGFAWRLTTECNRRRGLDAFRP
jgi:hypothetical protein